MIDGGIVMTNAEYRAKAAISRSDLFHIGVSPQKFRYAMDNPSPKTPSLIFGGAFHKYLLEPESFEEEYAVFRRKNNMPELNRRTKAGKEEWEAFSAIHAGKDLICAKDLQTIQAMAESVMRNKYAAALISKSRHELSFFWTDELTGEDCKCRPDILFEAGETHIIADIKTCADASADAFARDAVKYGYTMQAAMYTEGVQRCSGVSCDFLFLCVEKEPPYAVNLLQADELFLQHGEDTFRELIGIYHDCRLSGSWYGYEGPFGMIGNLSLPNYLRKEYE